MPDSQDLFYSDDLSSGKTERVIGEKWKIIIADDEEEVHNLTKMVMEDYTFDDKGVTFLSAFSGEQTLELLSQNPDTALLLLDVVMEEENTGLKLVEYIRNNLKNSFVRIILRTGQPGQAPEKKVIREYDINDYKSKIELTSQKLFTAVTSSLRSYKDLRSIEKYSISLKQLVQSSRQLFEIQSLSEFALTVLNQITLALDPARTHLPGEFRGVFLKELSEGQLVIIASTTSEHTPGPINMDAEPFPSLMPLIQDLNKENDLLLTDNFFLAYFPLPHDQNHYLYCQCPFKLDNTQQELLHLFTNNIMMALDNIYLVAGLEEARDQARESYRLKSEFLAIMSHEIRTPLTSMLGFSDLLSKSGELDPNNRKMAEMIYQSGKRLLQILTDVLELSVLEAGKQKTELKLFSIEQLIDDIFILLKTNFNRKNIEFLTEKLKGVMIVSDPQKIRQILYNLIGNALKFTEEGTVTLLLTITDEEYIFEIKDTGIGIQAEHESAIYEMFRQIEKADSRKYGGIGLGLTICQKMVHSLSGKIWFQSNSPSGTSFFFSLPRDKEQEQKSRAEYLRFASPVPPSTGTKQIYLAEDESTNAQLIKTIIESKTPYQIEIFNNGKELLEKLESNPLVHLIILDIQMPVLDGKDTLKLLTNTAPLIPVIALSAYSTVENKQDFLNLGFVDYLAKPIEPDEFIQAINRSLEKKD